MERKDLLINRVGVDRESQRLIFNFNNKECAELPYGIPGSWLADKLQMDVTENMFKKINQGKAWLASYETASIVPAGSIIEGREEPLKNDQLVLSKFGFDIDVDIIIAIQEKAEAYSKGTVLFKYVPVLKAKSTSTTSNAAAAKAAMEASAAVIVDEEEA